MEILQLSPHAVTVCSDSQWAVCVGFSSFVKHLTADDRRQTHNNENKTLSVVVRTAPDV